MHAWVPALVLVAAHLGLEPRRLAIPIDLDELADKSERLRSRHLVQQERWQASWERGGG